MQHAAQQEVRRRFEVRGLVTAMASKSTLSLACMATWTSCSTMIGKRDMVSAHLLQDMSDVTDLETIRQACAEGHDAADFLIQNVVQAELNDRGNYGEAFSCR